MTAQDAKANRNCSWSDRSLSPTRTKHGFSRAFPRAKYVYRDFAPTLADCPDAEGHRRHRKSRGLRALIESVYGDDADTRIPEALQGSFFDAEGRAGAERGAATNNVLDLARGYVRDGGVWDSDVRTPTPARRRPTRHPAPRACPRWPHRASRARRRARGAMESLAAQRSECRLAAGLEAKQCRRSTPRPHGR